MRSTDKNLLTAIELQGFRTFTSSGLSSLYFSSYTVNSVMKPVVPTTFMTFRG